MKTKFGKMNQSLNGKKNQAKFQNLHQIIKLGPCVYRMKSHSPHGPQHWNGCQHQAYVSSGQSEIRWPSLRNITQCFSTTLEDHFKQESQRKAESTKSIWIMKRTEKADARRWGHCSTSAENERLNTCSGQPDRLPLSLHRQKVTANHESQL